MSKLFLEGSADHLPHFVAFCWACVHAILWRNFFFVDVPPPFQGICYGLWRVISQVTLELKNFMSSLK